MKFFVAIFCVCLVQTSLSSASYSELNVIVKNIGNDYSQHIMLDGISEQFEYEIANILRTYIFELYVNLLIDQFVGELIAMSDGGNTKIDVNIVKKYSNSYRTLITVENVKVLQDILLKKFRREEINGVINMMYAMRPNATSDEIQNALDYLYGVQTEAPFIEIPNQTIFDCLNDNNISVYKHAIDQLKTIVDLKPKCVLDFIVIFEEFPCNELVPFILRMFMEILITFLKANESKIDVCTVKESDVARHWATDAAEEMYEREQVFKMMGSILATRLPDENFHGIVDFIEAFRPDTTNYGIQRRLKYLYVHVPRPTSPCNGSDVPTPNSTWLDADMLY